ncbi:hypothetical protein EIL87_16855 [Saccharopolyspora rhizosphaerae]|uniref:Uncharacterized protein n=1 Tax=Saccharopolyspora rhizosphaerae TaxID=2492662 RepID=A0A3R8Q064_9PSEU|nr:hypothetical protein [Saccharopolyspora rhizosphaerae]RRO15675.1 hypothetical protein EIL87_16855 [Saccharopolyspora rhizosphaerae]
MLKSTGSALVWWLARDESQVDDAVAKIPNLRTLTAAAHDDRVPELERGPEEHLLALVRGLQPDDEDERALLSDSTASTLEVRGHGDLAAKIRAEFAPRAPDPQTHGHVPAGSG